MRRAISKHSGDFLALIALFVVSTLVGGYILTQQRLRFPLVEEKPFQLEAEFSDAQAVIPGQGQTVRVAGVRVGDIGKVELENGRAVVRFDLDPKYKDLVHTDAEALLRPKTGLKDMFVELEPGTTKAPLFKEGGRIPVQNTAPDVDPDEVLSVLDTDTRQYLKLLISGAGDGLKGRGDDLREVFKRLEPLHRDVARVTKSIASRRENMASLVHNYGSLMTELAKSDEDLTTLVRSSDEVFQSFAAEAPNIETAVARLPGALEETSSTLAKVDGLALELGPTLTSLRPAFRQLDVANREVLPFVREAEPQIREQIRPFVRSARPYVRDLRPAAKDLARAIPDLDATFHELNRFFNMLGNNPRGKQPVSAGANRDEGYLYWLGWLSSNTNSMFSTADASGPFRRALAFLTCTSIREAVDRDPALEPVIGVTELLNDPGLCPP